MPRYETHYDPATAEYTATSPDHPECTSVGLSEEEALVYLLEDIAAQQPPVS